MASPSSSTTSYSSLGSSTTSITDSDLSQTENCIQLPDRTCQHSCKADIRNDWIASLFLDAAVTFSADGVRSEWRIGAALNDEKFIRNLKSLDGPHGVSGVFECIRIHGEIGETLAVCKIYLEIPGSNEPDTANSSIGVPERVDREIEALCRVTALDESNPGPRYISSLRLIQTKDMWLPGGYLRMILMEKLPGVTLSYGIFYSYPLAKRDEIRAAFTLSQYNLLRAGIMHHDQALRNLIWDDEAKKCYIVDYEDIDFISEKRREKALEKKFYPNAWLYWGLQRPRSLESNGL